jgi:hypothetical protein
MQRTVGECLRTPNDGEIGSDAGEGASHLGRGSSQSKAPLSHQFVGEEAISALTGLHCMTKLYFTEPDSVSTSQSNDERNYIRRGIMNPQIIKYGKEGQKKGWGFNDIREWLRFKPGASPRGRPSVSFVRALCISRDADHRDGK